MELHSPVATKRLWSYIRVAFFMLRKGLISKRKLIMDINLMMKRGKVMGKAVGNHVFNHHRARPRGYGYRLQEYEFSCNNSPDPVFFHAKRSTRHHYFPCISVVVEEENEGSPTVPSVTLTASAAAAMPRLHYSPNSSAFASSEEEEEGEDEHGSASLENNEVDNEAEKFIRMFYEQLRRQRRFVLLQYEIDYQEMLARGR